MLYRLPYFILALLVGLSSSVLFGGKVRADAPLFYSGSVTWAIGRRDSGASEDFDYTTLVEQLPRSGSIGGIYPELCGIPGNMSTQVYEHIPAFISVTSPELVSNGGYLYLGFCFAFDTHASWASNVSFSPGAITQRLSRAGSLAYSSGTNSVALTRDRNNQTTRLSNSAFSVYPSNLNLQTPDIYTAGFQLPDGSNFAKIAYFGFPISDFATTDYTFYNYGDTSTFWNRTFFFSCRITVPSGYQPDGYNTVWVDLSNALTAQFASQSTSLLFNVNGTPVTRSGYSCSCVYLCPVFAYATSFDQFQNVEAYLDSIVASLQNLSGNVSPSVLESYAAMASEARQAAEDAVRAMSIAAPTLGSIDADVFGQVDQQAKSQFAQILGFLRLGKILPIILAVFVLSLIAYVFFGKKG